MLGVVRPHFGGAGAGGGGDAGGGMQDLVLPPSASYQSEASFLYLESILRFRTPDL